jgi:CHASE2 domain-containing sensor protein
MAQWGSWIADLQQWFSNGRHHAVLGRALVAFVLFYVDPFGATLQRSRAIDQQFAWFASNFLTTYEPTKQVAVVLIGEDDLRSDSFKVDWPIPYGKVASIVWALACAHAKGVFFDFAASQQFVSATDRQALRTVINDSSKAPLCNDDRPPARIEVFFSSIDGINTTLSQEPDARDRAFWIGATQDETIYAVGRYEFPPGYPFLAKDLSPAFGILRKLCRQLLKDVTLCENNRLPAARAPLRLYWYSREDTDQRNVLRSEPGSVCRTQLAWGHVPLTLLKSLLSDPDPDLYQSCPPVLTLFARQLFLPPGNGDHRDPVNYLKNHFVFVGADLVGINDTVISPVHGSLPGVYRHAVALDNLLFWKTQYPTKPEPMIILALALSIYLVVEVAWDLCARSPHGSAAWVGILVGLAALVAWIDHANRWPISIWFAIFLYYFSGAIVILWIRSMSNRIGRFAFRLRHFQPRGVFAAVRLSEPGMTRFNSESLAFFARYLVDSWERSRPLRHG